MSTDGTTARHARAAARPPPARSTPSDGEKLLLTVGPSASRQLRPGGAVGIPVEAKRQVRRRPCAGSATGSAARSAEARRSCWSSPSSSVTLVVIGPTAARAATDIIVDGHHGSTAKASTSTRCTARCCSSLGPLRHRLRCSSYMPGVHPRRRGAAHDVRLRATSRTSSTGAAAATWTASPAATCSAGSPTTSTTSPRACSRRSARCSPSVADHRRRRP